MSNNKKRQILKELKETENYLSGDTLAEQLEISRIAIWKHIQKLKDQGYQITSEKGRGYKLIKSPDKLLPYEFYSLESDVVGRKIIHLEEVDSTMNYLEENPERKEGLVIFAEKQTGGRGRLKREWTSPKGGIWMSLLLKPKLPPERATYLTMISSLAVNETLDKIGLDSSIKWPNDILVKGNKISGVLTKIDAELETLNYSIVGIGINVNFEREDLPLEGVTTIKSELGKEADRKFIAEILLKRLDLWYRKVREERYTEVVESWRENCNTLGRKIKVKSLSGETYTGKAVKLTETGKLVVKGEDNTKRTFSSGDVSIQNDETKFS